LPKPRLYKDGRTKPPVPKKKGKRQPVRDKAFFWVGVSGADPVKWKGRKFRTADEMLNLWESGGMGFRAWVVEWLDASGAVLLRRGFQDPHVAVKIFGDCEYLAKGGHHITLAAVAVSELAERPMDGLFGGSGLQFDYMDVLAYARAFLNKNHTGDAENPE